MVATPDHWHALQMVQACEAGKDVYVEKPLSLTIAEGRRMVEVARQTQRVVQLGIQHRSSKFVKEAADFIRSGGIGHVTVAKCYHILNEGEILDADHARNFLDCVKSRKTCNCDIETGHRSTSATLLGNIALRSNSVIEWDAAQERVTNHSKANDLLSYRYRSPWRLA